MAFLQDPDAKNFSKMNFLFDRSLDVNTLMLADWANLEHVSQLRELSLGNNAINLTGMHAIAPNLVHLPKLTHLDLVSNQIGEAGAAILASHLRFLPKLRSLIVGGNQIRDGASYHGKSNR